MKNIKFFYKWFLLRNRRNPKLIKQETVFWKSNAIQGLVDIFGGKASQRAQHNIVQLEKECDHQDKHLITRDANGVEHQYKLPILAPEEEIRMNKSRRNHFFIFALLLIIDTFLFYFIAPYMLDGLSKGAYMICAFAGAFLVLSCWEFGFKALQKYFTGMRLIRQNQLHPAAKSSLNINLMWGIFLLLLAIAVTLAIGFVRLYTLEAVDVSAMQPGNDSVSTALSNKAINASSWASIASMIMSFISGLMLGFLNFNSEDFSVRGKAYKNYKRAERRINRLKKSLENHFDRASSYAKDKMEGNWKCVLYVRTVLKADYDAEDEATVLEFKNAKKQSSFQYDDQCYLKFEDVQCQDERLFKYGILNSASVIDAQSRHAALVLRYKELISDHASRHATSKSVDKPSRQPAPKQLTMGAATFMLLAMFLSSCGTKPKPSNIVIFVDRSSSLQPSTREFYHNYIQTTARYLKPGDKLRILPIDRNTESGSTELINLQIPTESSFSRSTDPPAQRKELMLYRFNQFTDSIAKTVFAGIDLISRGDSLLRNGTDILGAFRVSQNYMLPDNNNVLIILSDMLNYTKELVMEGKKIDADFIHRHMEQIKPTAPVKPWDGLFCITGPNTNMGPETFISVKKFWNEYFSVCGYREWLIISGEVSIVNSRMSAFRDSVVKTDWVEELF